MAKWFVEALEKADSRAKQVLTAEGLGEDDPDGPGGGGGADGSAADALQVAADGFRRRKVEQLTAQLRAKDALLAQLQADHAEVVAAKASEGRRYQDLLRALERDQAALQEKMEEERRRRQEAEEAAGRPPEGGAGEEGDRAAAAQRRGWERAQQEAREAWDTCQRCEEQLREVQTEFAEYKVRAARLLLERDRALQEGGGRPVGGANPAAAATLAAAEAARAVAARRAEEAREEADHLRQEQRVLVDQMVRMEAERKALEHRAAAAAQQAEADARQAQATIAALRQELEREAEGAAAERRRLTESLREREAAIGQLERRVATLEGAGAAAEAEARVQGLGERLLAKQRELEKAHWERETLARQVEGLQDRLRAAEGRPGLGDLEAGGAKDPTEKDGGGRWLGDVAARGGAWGGRALRAGYRAVLRSAAPRGTTRQRSLPLRYLLLAYVVALHLWVLVVLSRSPVPAAT